MVVDIDFSGISTGTERLLWNGRMPMFPGMGYPLVPGYESVGRVVQAGPKAQHKVGSTVFVPGCRSTEIMMPRLSLCHAACRLSSTLSMTRPRSAR